MTRADVARRLDVPPSAVPKFAADGLIGVRQLPRVHAIYSSADVERLAAEGQPATANAGDS